jgi:hypothetical protein
MVKKFLAAVSIFSALLLANCGKEEIGPVKDIGIYLNELDANGTDWIEFYNSTSQAVDITGFKVYDDAADKYTLASGSIPAGGFLILTCDGTGVGGNASFKLSATGETIYLEDNKGNLIDQVTFPALDNGSSYARFPDGQDDWRKTGIPTKNETNGNAQAATVQNVNRNPVVPAYTPAQAVTISATISDVEGIATVKLFSRKDGASFTSTNMTLSVDVYSASIAAPGSNGQIDYYIEVVNTRGVTTYYPENAPTVTLSYLLNSDVIPTDLRINEFLAFNSSCCPDNSSGTAEYNDWIEIYNSGVNSIDLNGYYLSDNSGNPFKFKIEGSAVIQAGGYLIIWADEQSSQGNLHASFQLSALGEEVGLYYKDGRTIDNKSFGAQSENVSYGRQTANPTSWQTFNTPTQAAQN